MVDNLRKQLCASDNTNTSLKRCPTPTLPLSLLQRTLAHSQSAHQRDYSIQYNTSAIGIILDLGVYICIILHDGIQLDYSKLFAMRNHSRLGRVSFKHGLLKLVIPSYSHQY